MIWWMAAALCAYFVKGLCGFANTLVFTTILSFGNSNINISPVELLLGYPTNAILAWKERREIKWNICVPLSVLVILGSVPGMLFLKNSDTTVIKIAFGFIIIVIGAEMLLGELRSKKARQSKAVLGVIGLLSGLLCGLYGIGALLGAYISRVTEDSHSFKANICVIFLAENTFRIILYWALGIIELQTVRQTAALIPLMLLGLWLGMLSGRFLNDKLVKKIVIIMLIISGLALVITNAI